MHQIKLPEWILDGSRMMHRFDKIDPSRTALLVIDMQAAFVEDGYPFATQNVRDIVPNVNRLGEALRQAGGLVAFTRHTVSDEPPYRMAEWLRESPMIASGDKFLRPDAAGHEVHSSLDRRPEDITVNKFRFSAFTHHSSPLDGQLRERGIDTLLITGTVTNCCCETTARDASMLGYRIVFITDANAALSDEEHNATLLNIATVFGDLRSTDEAIGLIRKG